MMKLIVKNLWARRKRNVWLFAELVAVAVVSWVILDPVIVGTYVRFMPMGYDVDRLCRVSLGRHRVGAPQYVPDADSTLYEDLVRIVRQAKSLPDVESSTPLIGFAYPGSLGNSNSRYVNKADTTKELPACIMYYKPRTDFFLTFGLQPADGCSLQQLEEAGLESNAAVMTENGVENLFGADRRQMEFYGMQRKGVDYTNSKVVKGIIKPFKMYNSKRPIPMVFLPINQEIYERTDVPGQTYVLIRVKDGVSMNRFIERFNADMMKQLHSGNLYACAITKYVDVVKDQERVELNEARLKGILAAFFLINLCLGVIGAFWLQTKVRRQDIGIMKSFGGTPSYIVCMLMGEGALLTTVAVGIGCFIYLQYAFLEGVYIDTLWGKHGGPPQIHSWIDSFGIHFLIVSAVIYVLMLAVVLIGIYIPAHHISRIRPTEALRDE